MVVCCIVMHFGARRNTLYTLCTAFCPFLSFGRDFFRWTLNLIISTTVSGTVPVEASFLYKDMSEWS